jgi:hypothetical protein
MTMTTTFTIKRGKRGRLGSLAAAVEAESIHAAAERQFVAQYIRHCAVRGLVPKGEIHIEAQVNWLTCGLDVTATAYVRDAGRKKRAAGACSEGGLSRRRTGRASTSHVTDTDPSALCTASPSYWGLALGSRHTDCFNRVTPRPP